MSSAATPSEAVRGPIAGEDQARADFYALLARLYAGAPDAALLRAIAQAEDLSIETRDAGALKLTDGWRTLKAASREMDPQAVAQEYVDLFVGVGKSEVSLHAAAYLKSAGGSVLADMRSALQRIGLTRQAGTSIYEDHLAAVLETMRVLIGGAPGVEVRPISEQRAFFGAYVAPWVAQCCAAILTTPIANYYRRVAEFTDYFMAIERDSLAMD